MARRAFHPAATGARRRQRGLALVTAVLIVAIVATIATSLALGQQIWIRQAQNFSDRAQADKVMDGALQFAMLILEKDLRDHPETDDLGEDWAKPQMTRPVEGGTATGRISDAQGRFNLNSLLRKGVRSTPDIGVFRRLLQSLMLNDGALTDTLLDWMDADGETAAGGAEDIYYLTLQPPYRTANQRLQSVDELRLVRGFDAATVEALRPYVVALPEETAININTAGPEVLAALFNSLSLSAAKHLVEQRDKSPFKDKAELERRAGQAPADKVEFDIKSAYFLSRVDTRFGRLQRSRQALISRAAGGKRASIVWQENVYGVPAVEEDTE